MGVDRRQRDEIYYVDGIPKERRSGQERRKNGGDRRNGHDPVSAKFVDLGPAEAEDSVTTEKAARLSEEPAAGGSAAYH